MNESTKWLYEKLSSHGYNVGASADVFDSLMVNNPESRKWAYDTAQKHGYNVGEYDMFERLVGAMADGVETTESGSVVVSPAEAKENADSINQFLENRDALYTGLQDYNTGIVSGTEQRRRDDAAAEAEAQAEAMRQRLQENGTIDRMKESKKEARREKLRAFGSMLGSTPQVSSFGVSSNVFDSTEEQLADVGQSLDAGTEYRQNKLLQEKLDVALDMARAGENQDGLRGVENFGLGLWDSATRLSTWDFGASDIVNNLTLMQIVEKWENDPSSLTATEQKVLEGIGMATAVQELYSDQVGIGYNVGQSLPESAGFMASMALNPASGLGKSLARNAVRTYGRNSIAKNLARIGGDIAETAIMTATTGAGRVAADALERINGSSTYEVGENGVIMYGGQKDQETVGSAVIKAIGANFIENYSEALGEYFDPLLGMSRKVAAGGLRKMNLNKWADALSDVQPSQMTASIRSLREKTKFGGIFGEVMEEEIGMALNAISGVGDYTFSKEKADKEGKQWIFDLENQLTTVLSCAIMSGTLNGVEQVSSVAARRKMEKNAKNAEQDASYRFSSAKFAPLREAIDQASPEGMVDVLRDVYMSQEYTAGQKRALAEYAAARLQLQYYNAADAKARRQVNKTQQELLDAQEAGLNAQLPQLFNIARAAQFAEDELLDYDGDFNLVDIIRSSMNRPEEMERILGDLPPREAQLVTNYIYSRARMEGAYQGRSNRAEDYVDDFAYALEPAVVTDADGNRTITTALLGDRSVYVLDNNGDLAHIMRPDGSKTLVKASELTNITTSSAEEVIDRYRDMYTSQYNAETENAFNHHLKTQAPQVGLQLQSPEGEVVITAINDNMVEIVPAVYKDGQVQPKEGAEPKTITVDDAYAWQDSYYQGLDDAEAATASQPTVDNVSAETLENESTPTEEIKQSVSEEVADGQIAETQPTETEGVAPVAPAAPQTARERVPKDKKGNPIYEQTDADTAWDAIVEETEGNVEMAQSVAEQMLANKRAALEKLQNGKAKPGANVAQIIANEKKHQESIAKAEADVKAWERISQVNAIRQQRAELERAEAEKAEAEQRKAEEARMLAEQEEQARIEREALNGVPDMVDDTPQDARARGYRRVNGHKVDRQGVLPSIQGKEVGVKFANDMIANGHVAVIEAETLQPSHLQGQRNPAHFIDEAQPKERNDEASIASARKIASNIRPEEITTSVTAYTGAPTVNVRGEAIQGNSRSDALRVMWAEHPDQAEKYKQYLIDHAEEFGLNAEEVAAMQHPVLVNMLDVSDADAISLGQYVAQDTESGGTERIKAKNVARKMGSDIRSYANILLRSAEEDASFAELVDKNGVEVLKWMNTKGYITPTQYASAFDSKGNMTAEAKNDLRGILYQSIFQGGNTQLEEQFNAMPAKAQKAILATAYRDYDSPESERMVGEIQSSIRAYYALSHDRAFVDAKSYKEAKEAMLVWSRQYQMDDVTGESFLPSENFSNFALELAVVYKGWTQNNIQSHFNNVFDLVQGTKEASLFEEADNTPHTLAEAIKETFNIEYNGQLNSNSLAVDSQDGQAGERGSDGDTASGERAESGEGSADSGRGAYAAREQGEVDGKRKVTANYFEMAEEAQRNRKAKKKSNDTARRSIQELPAEADRVSGEIFGGDSRGEEESVPARSDGGILEEGAGKKKRTAKARRQSDNRQETRDGKAERLSRGISAVQQQAIDEYTRTNPWDANLTDEERGVLNMYRMATLNELDELAHKLADKINSGKATPRDRMRYDVLAAYAKSGELKAVADAMGVEYGKPVSLDTIKSLFETFNSDADLAKLFDRVFPLVKEINPTIIYRRFTEADIEEGEDVSPDDILGQYSLQENLIEYNRNQIDSNHCTEQEKASTIVHEMIHAVARYAIRVQEAHNDGVELDIQLPKRLLDAAQSLIEVYDAIKDNEIFNDDRYESGKMYGVSSVHEMLSELANPEFREKLKQVSIENLPSDKKGRVRDALRAIKDFIHRMFGWGSSSAYARTKRALDKLIDNYDSAGYNKARELADDDFAQQIRLSSDENLRSRKKEDDQDAAYMNAVERGDMETAQRMVDEVLEDAGYTIRGEHGTTHKFTIFNNVNANIENSFGKGFYFTSDAYDAEQNYSHDEGPDLKMRIELLAERMEFEDAYEDMDYDERLEEARKRLSGGENIVISAAIRMKNPCVFSIDPDGVYKETVFDVEEEYDEENDEYGDPTGLLVDFVNALNEVLSEGDYWGADRIDASELIYDGYYSADQLKRKVYEMLMDIADEEGNLASNEIFRSALERMGFDGIIDNAPSLRFKNMGLSRDTKHYIAFSPNQIKQSDAVTYDNDGNIIPLSERANRANDDIRFRDGSPFFSNAERAVDNIKQQKATPEQWLAMIKKDGGLKAGEDKWMGLSDWLNEQKEKGVKTLTKDEVLAFIRENQIEIEEVEYEEGVEDARNDAEEAIRESLQEMFDAKVDEVRNENPEQIYMSDIYEEAFERVCAEVGYNKDDAPFVYTNATITLRWYPIVTTDELLALSRRLGFSYEGSLSIPNAEQINSTRLDYTTEGLDNKREIALVVPTIESWNQSDTIHFGDAGEGRAVAWVRFGETTDEDGNRVLVIDEVQSKRHDEGRAKGYKSEARLKELDREYDKLIRERAALTNEITASEGVYNNETMRLRAELGLFGSDEQVARYREIDERLYEVSSEQRRLRNAIPDAPFDKNYHELVMKRMLRYAAENGFDKVAWTKGAQQAERYNLNKVFDSVEREDNPNLQGKRFVLSGANAETIQVGDDGVVVDATIADAKGKTLESVVGVDMAKQMMSLENGDMIEGQDFAIGGEGMKGYYDEMIPRFMNKYTKKWGTKVGEVTLPNVEEAGRTMWSVDVTPEMRESVMQGQPMFREGMGAISDREVSYENDPIAKFQGKPRYYGKRAAAFAERERRRMENAAKEAAEMLGIEAEIVTDASTLQGRKAKAKGWYDIVNKKVVVVVPNHVSMGDAVRTVLHEGVAHHGLRELFGAGFDAMLDNVYNNVAPELKARIDAIAERTGVSTQVATEEYLASLAETTNFEEAQRRGWWQKIKSYFVDMLRKLSMPGIKLKEEITDNELRYLLWRSYKNLVEPNSYLRPLGYAEDVAKQKELKVGEYAENTKSGSRTRSLREWIKDTLDIFGSAAYTAEGASDILDILQMHDGGKGTPEETEEVNAIFDYYGQSEDYYDPQVIRTFIDALYEFANVGSVAAEMKVTEGNTVYDRTTPKTKEEAKSRIRNVLNIANSIKNKVFRAVIGGVTKRQESDFARLGFKIDNDWVHSFENSGFIHGSKHMNKEERASQMPITEEDLMLIPNILEDYDTVAVSDNKNKQGKDVLIYKKVYPDGTIYYLEEVRTRRKSLAFQTMYKKRSDSSDGLLNENSTPSTSKTPSDNHASFDKDSDYSSTMQENEENILYRLVDDQAEIERLESEPTIKAYRAMQVINGELYPPMSAVVDGKLREPIALGQWEQSEERPDLADDKGRFKLDKGNKKSLKAAYNPYFHSSSTPLNDQFSEAQDRDNLVTVEVEVPVSEADGTSGYKAEKAKDAVGTHQWKAGIIQGQLTGTREVFLTRWDKPIRIVPESEVADVIVEMFDGKDIVMSSNVVTPQLRKELEARGITFVETDNQGKLVEGEHKGEHYSKVYGKKSTNKSKKKAEIIAEIERESAALGVPVRIARSVDEFPDEDTRKRAVDGKLKGYYDPRTGEVVLYEPNTDDANDAKRTVLHEIVGHKGLRQLIGEQRYDKAMLQLMYMLPADVRDAVLRRAERHGWNAAIAMDEYLAEQAERDVQPTWWGKVNAKIRAILRNIGFDVKLTDADVTYLLWRSRKKLQGDSLNDMAVNAILKQAARKSAEAEAWNEQAFKDAEMRDFESNALPSIRHRMGADTNDYEKAMRTLGFKQAESWQDSMRSLLVFQEAIAKASGKDISDFENAYMYENRMSSANLMEMEQYRHMVYNPLLKEIHELEQMGASREDTINYLFAKSGLERNEVFARRDAKKHAEGDAAKEQQLYDKYRQKDYAGLTALTRGDAQIAALVDDHSKKKAEYDRLEQNKKRGVSVSDADLSTAKKEMDDARKAMITAIEAEAQRMVDEFEAQHNTDNLWDKIRNCTHTTLNISHDAGVMSDEVYNELWNQFQYYIPLRGFAETTAEDVYLYLGGNDSPYNAPIKTAYGRTSLADDPIATIGNMAESAIVEANRNRLKQRFLYMVERHNTDLASISDVWLEYDDVNDEWHTVFAQIPDDATPSEAKRLQQEFEDRMKQLAEQNPGKYANASQQPNIPYRVVKKGDRQEHHVIVKRNGKDVVITINGNPRVAQAINGLTNPEQNQGMITRITSWINRNLSANFTMRNPAFMVSNFVRDGFYTNSMVWVKENPAYAWQYNKNWAICTAQIASLVKRYKRYEKGDTSALDMNNDMDRMFYEFMINGGETGYTVIKSVEDYKGLISGEMKKMEAGAMGTARRVADKIGDVVDTFGRWAEDTSRFAAYMTSRQLGRTITKSIWDAKEISVNFNKKGSGNRMMGKFEQGNRLNYVLSNMSQLGRNLYVFWNAGVQGFNNFKKAAKDSPAKFTAMAGSYFTLGVIVAAAFSGDDDEDDYYNLPEYVRRNNICFKIGKGKYATLPLPIEIRAIYGLGELAYSYLSGREGLTHGEAVTKTIQQMTQVLPIDMMADGGGAMALVPSAAKPVVEVIHNVDWTGHPIYKEKTPWNQNDPTWTLAFKSTSPELVQMSRLVNEWTNKNTAEGLERPYNRGWADNRYLNNPAVWEHIAEGYLGGIATIAIQTKKTLMMPFNEDLREVRNVPIVSRFVKDAGKEGRSYAARNEYYDAKNIMDSWKNEMSKAKKEVLDESLTDEQRLKAAKLRSSLEQQYMEAAERWKVLDRQRKALEEAYKNDQSEENRQALDDVMMQMATLVDAYK